MENKNILVVEDDNSTRDTMVDLLSEAGYEVQVGDCILFIF